MAQSSTACLFARTSQLSLRARGCSPGLREAALRCVSRNTTCAASLTTGGFACIRDRVWLGTECMAGRLVPHARLSSAPGHAPPPLPSPPPHSHCSRAPSLVFTSQGEGRGRGKGKGEGKTRTDDMAHRRGKRQPARTLSLYTNDEHLRLAAVLHRCCEGSEERGTSRPQVTPLHCGRDPVWPHSLDRYSCVHNGRQVRARCSSCRRPNTSFRCGHTGVHSSPMPTLTYVCPHSKARMLTHTLKDI